LKQVEVAAGVLLRDDGAYLLGQRGPDTVYAGYWEFPGGKLETGETPAAALKRELAEELGIEVLQLRPWLVREHQYEHAHVRLHFFEVVRWQGSFQPRVHAELRWVDPQGEAPAPMLPANGPVLKALRLPRQMGITHASQLGVDAQLAALDQALAGGLRLVQLREAALPEPARTAFITAARERVHRAGGIVLLNDEPAAALAAQVDGVHLNSARLMALTERPAVPWVGASCHERAELEHAAALGLDYALLGPVLPTVSHPGEPTLGWAKFAELVRELPLPVLALGGLSAADMETARNAGAHGLAAIRAVWQSAAQPG
jgi:8-oxo-dGTP diphosphatase